MPENARIEQESFQRITTSHRREYLGESSDDACSDRTYGDQRPLEEGRCHGQHGRPHNRRRYEDGGYSGRWYSNRGGGPPDGGGPLMIEDPLMVEDPQIMEDPLVMEGPLMMEDPQEMEGILDTLEDKDPLVPQDLLDQ